MSRKKSCHFTTTTSTPLLVIVSLRLFLSIHFLFCCYSPTIIIVAAMATTTNRNKNTRTILSKCACGSVRVEIPFDALHEVPTVDCHCPACRKYHVAGLVRYLKAVSAAATTGASSSTTSTTTSSSSSASNNNKVVSILSNNGSQPPALSYYQEYCQQLGRVERIRCQICDTKLATRPLEEGKDDNMLLINMGPLVEDSIPTDLITYWTLQRSEQWQIASKATWTNARPSRTTRTTTTTTTSNPEGYSTRRITGGCACGKCQYEVDWEEPTELQHCYCKLCRRFSGGAYMTWTPVWKENFRWLNVPTSAEQLQQQQQNDKNESNQTSQDEREEITTSFTAPGSSSRYLQMLSSPRKSLSPPSSMLQQQQQQQQSLYRYGPPPLLKRTSSHGQRHFCPNCGGALTIVYDDQPDCIWPAVGGFDDDSFIDKSSGNNTSTNNNNNNKEIALERVIHICCRYKQKWYQLPQDGLPRIAEAS